MELGFMPKGKNIPEPTNNPKEKLKEILKKIVVSENLGKLDNETREDYDKRTASYFDKKRLYQSQI